jgi:hypothetical protein
MGKAQIVERLQIEPKLCASAKEMRQTQSRISREGACSVQNLRYSICRNVEPASQLGGTHIQQRQFLSQMLAWMDNGYRHDVLLVIVNNFNIRRAWHRIRPLEANAPLVIYSNAVLTLTIATQVLETISWQYSQIPKVRRRVQSIEF